MDNEGDDGAASASQANVNTTDIAAYMASLKFSDPAKYKELMTRILNGVGGNWEEEKQREARQVRRLAEVRQALEEGAFMGFGISAGAGSVGSGRRLLQASAAPMAGAAGGADGAVNASGAGSNDTSASTSFNPFTGKQGAPSRCPFRTSKCLADDPEYRGRYMYLHGGGGFYDTRYENLLVLHGSTPDEATAAAMAGHTNAGFGPLSLARYGAGTAFESVRATSSASRMLADYPIGSSKRSLPETYAELGRILQAYGFPEKKAPGGFKSCCASMMLRPHHIRRWPVGFYKELLGYTLDGNNTYHATLAISHHGWAMWAPGDTSPGELMRYFQIDVLQHQIRGCPAWRMLDPAAAAAKLNFNW